MNKAISRISYTKGYKYQLEKTAFFDTNIKPKNTIKTLFITLQPTGHLIIDPGYAFDGASGLALDTDDFMRGSLAHDVMAQLCRMKLLSKKNWFDEANRLLLDICKQDGMWWWRLIYVEWGINTSICHAAFSPDHRKTVYKMP